MGRKRQENIFEMAAKEPWRFGVIMASVAYVTTGEFTSEAREFAQGKHLDLIDGATLLA